jgi:hypothetical protein
MMLFIPLCFFFVQVLGVKLKASGHGADAASEALALIDVDGTGELDFDEFSAW